MNKFDYVTGYLPDDATSESRQYKTRKRVHHISKGTIYLASIASVIILAVFALSFMGIGNSISASSKPSLIEPKQKTEEQPIWQSISMENSNKESNTVNSIEDNSPNMYMEDLERLFNNQPN